MQPVKSEVGNPELVLDLYFNILKPLAQHDSQENNIFRGMAAFIFLKMQVSLKVRLKRPLRPYYTIAKKKLVNPALGYDLSKSKHA